MTTVARQGAGQLYALAKGQGTSGLFKYPSDLFSPGAEPFIIFNIIDAVARGGARKGSVATYMPPTLRVRYQAQYEEISLDFDRWFSMASNLPNVFGSQQGFSDAGAALITGALDTALGTNARDKFDQFKSRTLNPHMAVLFRGVGYREFEFTFQMMARNEGESRAIQNIIYQFKYAMHPKFNDSTTKRWMQYPEEFEIEFFTPTEEYMFKINRCVLTGMEVDYAGSGVPSFFSETGAPVDIRMSLQFKELGIVTKEDIEKGS